MSGTLHLRRLAKSSAEISVCLTPKCARSGIYVPEIAGQPSIDEHGARETLCSPCALIWRRAWLELSGEKLEREVSEALAALQAAFLEPQDRGLHTQSTDAIDFLLENDFDKEAIRAARIEIEDGAEVEDAVPVLFGVGA